jgi:hypothetical protein
MCGVVHAYVVRDVGSDDRRGQVHDVGSSCRGECKQPTMMLQPRIPCSKGARTSWFGRCSPDGRSSPCRPVAVGLERHLPFSSPPRAPPGPPSPSLHLCIPELQQCVCVSGLVGCISSCGCTPAYVANITAACKAFGCTKAQCTNNGTSPVGSVGLPIPSPELE